MNDQLPTQVSQSNTEKLYKVRRDELPLSCPTNEMALWNSHPRVYLPIEAEKDVTCPYCCARYILEE